MPLEINVDHPQGSDLIIWDTIMNNADYGWFLQQRSAPKGPRIVEFRQVIETLRQLVNLYPTSAYAENIQLSLAKHEAISEINNDIRALDK